MNALVVNLHDRVADRKHTELFILLTSVCLSSKFDVNVSATSLQNAFGDNLATNTTSVFQSEMNCWVKFCKTETEKASEESKEYQDSFIDMLKYADHDCFPKIRIRFATGCISAIGLVETERKASGVRLLKIPSHVIMLKFLQLQRIKKAHPEEVSVLLIDLHKSRLFK